MKGDQGDNGNSGANGTKGDRGPQGPKGAQGGNGTVGSIEGAAGAKGNRGEKGPSGESIVGPPGEPGLMGMFGVPTQGNKFFNNWTSTGFDTIVFELYLFKRRTSAVCCVNHFHHWVNTMQTKPLTFFYYILWTVPTKYGFCAKLGPCAKSRSLQKLLESKKKNRGSHAFFRDN